MYLHTLFRTFSTTPQASILGKTFPPKKILHFGISPLGSFLLKRHYASDDPVDFSKIKIPPQDVSTATPENPEYYGIFKVGHDETYGDYPAMKWIPWDKRDPYATYDDPVNRRNFGEILHAEDEILSAHAPASYYPESLKKSFFKIATFFSILGGLWLLSYEVVSKQVNPLANREYDFPKFEGNKELERLLSSKRKSTSIE
ncbi:hypothetical protein HMI54_001361 [Coelomomyces lativittatus]|nr:hypothetical protein HMI56_004665 [Coelomomyces lativittatus]KAJ1516519.1 hypothetical protein HMI55_002060 [Coelomomyces lativittatus]KAJ1518312.1 hypothetical protein HMI54_001361 [Coelomomyces lativittatus]